MFTLVSLSLMGGGQVEALDLLHWKSPKIYVWCFFLLTGVFSPRERPFPFWGLFSLGGGGGGGFFFFYFEIYLDMSPLTKISAGVHASAAKVVPNILEHRVI